MQRLIKPYIAFEEIEDDFKEIFDSGHFTKGHFVNDFVLALNEYIGAKHTFLTTSATTALSTCLKLLNVGPGDEVIVSDFSFPATVNVVEDVGACPVFADVDRDTYNMIPAQLEEKITPRTRAVIFVDALGNPSGIGRIKEICEARKIPLIDDAACGIGSSERGRMSGSIADLSCFSFHPRKLLTTGEGGAITTNNGAYAQLLAVKLNHGSVYRDGKFDFIDYGYNFRLPELQAAMGLRQLRKLDSIIQGRQQIKDAYQRRLTGLGFSPQQVHDDVVHNVQSVVFTVPDGVNRDALIMNLRNAGVETTLGTYCLSDTSYYRHKYNQVQPVSRYLQEHTITLPCYDGVECELVCEAIASAIEKQF